jgi:VWFA-related protein
MTTPSLGRSARVARSTRLRIRRAGAGLSIAFSVAAACLAILSAQQAPPAKPPAGGTQAADKAPPQQPVFRAGANFVRVDAYATRKDIPVQDMRKEDFEVLEDGVPQTIDTFEHVVVRAGGPQAERVEPRSVAEGNQMAADPRSRVFILFLDTLHVRMTASRNVERALTRLLDQVIGAEDLVALMTPLMPAAGITFTRRTDSISQLLMTNPWWGERTNLIRTDETEKLYESCYPPADSQIAQVMINRRRERMTLDALEDVVRHLDGLREERKAILMVSEGWVLYRPDRSLAEARMPAPPGIFVGPNGRLSTSDTRNPGAGYAAQCDQDRLMLSALDDERHFRDLMDEANRANATFYPINPRGLAVFDSDMGPAPPPPLTVDMDAVKTRTDSLLTLADATDGVSVVNTNDISGGIKRVVSDLTSYYLIGYSSTNSKLDGRYRAIKVRSKRPGVDVRSRRGYKAPTEEEVAARNRAVTAAETPDEAAPVKRAIATLDTNRADSLFRLLVAPGWWKPASNVPTSKAGRPEPAVWVIGEIDTRRPGDDWSKGAEAEISLARESGPPLATFKVDVPAGAGRFVARFPRTSDDVWLDPGKYSVKVRVRAAAGGLPTTDTVRFSLEPPPEAARPLLGQPIYFRKGNAAVSKEQPTADTRYRRSERVVVDVSASDGFTDTSGALLDRTGRAMELPVTVTTREEGGARWIRVEVALAPLAAGDYVVRLAAGANGRQEQVLAPFRIIP